MECSYFDKFRGRWIDAIGKVDEDQCMIELQIKEIGDVYIKVFKNTVFKMSSGLSDTSFPVPPFAFSFHLSTQLPKTGEEVRSIVESFCVNKAKDIPLWKKAIRPLVDIAEDRGISPTEDDAKLFNEETGKKSELNPNADNSETDEEEVEVIKKNTVQKAVTEQKQSKQTNNVDMPQEQSFSFEVLFRDQSFQIYVTQREAETLPVSDLKARIFLHILSSNPKSGITTPEELLLTINGSRIGDSWSCGDFFLHPFSILQVLNSSEVHVTEESTVEHQTSLFTLHMENKTLVIHSGDVPEKVARKFVRQHSLDSAKIPGIVLEIYKGLTRSFLREIKQLGMEIDTLNIQKKSRSDEEVASVHATLLKEAAQQIYFLQQDKKTLNQKVLDLNLKLAGLTSEVS